MKHFALQMKRRIEIEKLLQWVYCDELVKGGSEAYTPWDRMQKLRMQGVMVDESYQCRLPAIFGDPHPDAIVVARYVDRLPHRVGVLLIIHAWKNSRPEPFRGSPSVFPVRDGPRVRVIGKSHGRASKGRGGHYYYDEGAYCPLRFVPSLDEIAASRRDWTLWRAGLLQLLRILPVLDGHEPVWSDLPEAPWL